MKLRTVLASLALATALTTPAAAQEKRPNFLVIVADDLGYSDLGAFGSEISTPNLDRLALSGVRLTGFHTAPTCSPTRSMLLSGTDNHRAGLGTMAEMQAPNQVGKPGHEGYLRTDIAALPEVLTAGGYRTLFSGKWHLGLTPEQDPHARGFQHSFALLQGAGNHYGTDISATPKPGFTTYREDGRTLESLPSDYYSSDAFATKLIDQIKTTKDDKPFFAYLAFTAPHWPLQAPAETIAKYKGRYEAGYEALRAERLKKQIALGLVPASAAQHPLENSKPWAELTPDEKKTASRTMEIYAAMVDRLDQNVGRVIDALKASGEYDNTVILFLADNGAEGMDLVHARNPRFRARAEAADNSYDNLGKDSSYISYGPGWAQAATTPSWLYKAFATEGGTRTTAFLSGPAVKKPGSIAHDYLNVMDIAPTLIDLAGIAPPKGTFQGRTVQPIRGTSWAPWLAGTAPTVHPASEAIGTELFGSRALRQGDWKITDAGDGQWHLFNIVADPGETTDLSAREPARRAALEKAWDAYASDVGVVLPNPRIMVE
ncbi:arylsulfatase [Sphingobium yanoikuyae]|jgi:arylsulfatase A-like enzyme|uniref:arylsulfatase n=1 Tax=Sphingobium yanoikuyae TaxID=13690 RepID=UPI0003C14802|nr:arylsulfatase [Sphingobium yanoikuyae]MDG2511287.1 arylsulfatase [Sphingobium yanoikuyae]